MPRVRSRLLSGVWLFRRGNDSDVWPYDRGVDPGIPGYAARARSRVALRSNEVRAVDQLHFVVGGFVRSTGVCAMAIARLLAGALAGAESEISFVPG